MDLNYLLVSVNTANNAGRTKIFTADSTAFIISRLIAVSPNLTSAANRNSIIEATLFMKDEAMNTFVNIGSFAISRRLPGSSFTASDNIYYSQGNGMYKEDFILTPGTSLHVSKLNSPLTSETINNETLFSIFGQPLHAEPMLVTKPAV